MRHFLAMTLIGLVSMGCVNSRDQPTPEAKRTPASSEHEIVLGSEVVWGALNPARGDQSPRAADLWGDRTENEATGFLVKFVDGFSSPPHIHNVAYRGVVIQGEIHNDDPRVEMMWMPAGSFWVQPAGGNHITAARGQENMAYIEIGSGPYLVRPTDQAFSSSDEPINVDASDIVWIDQPHGVQVAYLWGDVQDDRPSGAFLKLPAGFEGSLESHGTSLRAIVVAGNVELITSDQTNASTLGPGSYFGVERPSSFNLAAKSSPAATLYLRVEGLFDIQSE